VEREDVVARDNRKAAERRAATEMPTGEYVIVDGKGADAKMRIDDAGTCTLLAGSKLRQNAAPSIPQSSLTFGMNFSARASWCRNRAVPWS
jgi:hypothetical protein